MSTGLHVRRAAGLTVAERKESFARTESVARWSREGRAAYEADREPLLFDLYIFFFLTRCKVLRSGRKLLHERGRRFFFFPNFWVHFHCFWCAAVPCCAFSFVHRSADMEHIKRRKSVPYLGYLSTCDIHDAKRMWRPSSFLLKHGGGILGLTKSPVRNYNHKKLYSIMDLCPLRII